MDGCYTRMSKYNGFAMYSSPSDNSTRTVGTYVIGAVQIDPTNPYEVREFNGLTSG